MSVLQDEVAAQLAAEHETHRVAGDRGCPDNPDQQQNREGSLAREHATEDDRHLARRDEPDERRCLGKCHERDEQVGKSS